MRKNDSPSSGPTLFKRTLGSDDDDDDDDDNCTHHIMTSDIDFCSTQKLFSFLFSEGLCPFLC